MTAEMRAKMSANMTAKMLSKMTAKVPEKTLVKNLRKCLQICLPNSCKNGYLNTLENASKMLENSPISQHMNSALGNVTQIEIEQILLDPSWAFLSPLSLSLELFQGG
jgi:hypothetical protein